MPEGSGPHQSSPLPGRGGLRPRNASGNGITTINEKLTGVANREVRLYAYLVF